MQTFEVTCRHPGTAKPYVVLISAETKAAAVTLAARSHTVDPSELPPAFPTEDPADKVGRTVIRMIIITAGTILGASILGSVLVSYGFFGGGR